MYRNMGRGGLSRPAPPIWVCEGCAWFDLVLFLIISGRHVIRHCVFDRFGVRHCMCDVYSWLCLVVC